MVQVLIQEIREGFDLEGEEKERLTGVSKLSRLLFSYRHGKGLPLPAHLGLRPSEHQPGPE